MFDLRSVSLATGEQHRVDVPVEIAPFTIGGVPYGAVPATVSADLAITRLRNGWVFDEAFLAEVHGPCHRCLEPAVVPIDVDTTEFHAFRPEPGSEADMMCEFLRDERDLDTDAMASAAVVLAMPVRVLCRDDCRGLCPRCGANLNLASCDCPADEPDERWSKLRELQ